ncbi:hypothetical protein NDU88_001824 [Pleurodeles waltl]|uniref:Uncharacterized protein n=1 Tax=Pleurodeles waltl TaxID=8319 RepID=A0AAV7LH49_PLEWA|nr:hypothetical protein NDU88_001824 [Pleurodeles waltl]
MKKSTGGSKAMSRGSGVEFREIDMQHQEQAAPERREVARYPQGPEESQKVSRQEGSAAVLEQLVADSQRSPVSQSLQRCVPNAPGPPARGQPAVPACSVSIWGHSRPSRVDHAGRRHSRGRPHKQWGYGTSTRKNDGETCSARGPPTGQEAPRIRRRGMPTMKAWCSPRSTQAVSGLVGATR